MRLFKSSILTLSLAFSFLSASESQAIKIFVENQTSVLYAPINNISNTIRIHDVGEGIDIDENTLQQGQYILKIPQGDGSEREIGFLVINNLLPGRAMQIYMNNDGFVTLYFNGNTDHYAVQAVSNGTNKTKNIKNLAGESTTFHNDQFDTELLISKGDDVIHVPLFPELKMKEVNIIEFSTIKQIDNTLQSQKFAELYYDINQALNTIDQADKDVMQHADSILNIEEMYTPQLQELLTQNFTMFTDHEVLYNWLINSNESAITPALDIALGCSFQRKDKSNDYEYMLYVASLVKFCCDHSKGDDATHLKNDLMQHLNDLGNKGAHIANVTKAHMFLVLHNSLRYLAKLYSA